MNLTMAKRNYLVEGLSGVGKSWVYEKLIRRGYTAISADRAWAYYADPETGRAGGPVGHDSWVWDRNAAVRELASPEPEVLFVCGSSRNSDQFLRYFTKVFNNRAGEKLNGAIDVDATRPLDQVVNELLRLVDLDNG